MGYLKKQLKRAKTAIKKRYTGAGALKRVMKDVAYVKNLVNSELKYQDFNGGGTMAVGSAAGWSAVNSLNTVTQGDAPTNRQGAQIRMKSLQIKGNIERNAGNHRVRMIILLDKQPLVSGALGTVVPPSAVFKDPTDLNSLREWEGITQKRFSILYSRTFDADADELQHDFKIYKKLNLPVVWSSTSASSTDITRNRLYLVFMSDNPTGTDINYSFEARITFRDN